MIVIIIIVNLVRIQPDLGTSLVIFIAGLYILFLAGLSWRFIGASFTILILSIPFIWNNFLEPFQRQRILTLLDPTADPYGSGWNITQSKIAIGSGEFKVRDMDRGLKHTLIFCLKQKQILFCGYSRGIWFYWSMYINVYILFHNT